MGLGDPVRQAKGIERCVLALFIGAMGGFLFHSLHAPVPWMMGAMLATSVAAIFGAPITVPRGLRNAFVPVLGVLFGSAVDVHVLLDVKLLGKVAVFITAYLAVAIGFGYLYFRTAGLDPASSFFASVPGNFSEMVLVAETMGADIRSVALVHSARLVISIPIISFSLQAFTGIDVTGTGLSQSEPLNFIGLTILVSCGAAGYVLARLIRMPAPQMFGPLLLSAAVYGAGWVEGAPPTWAVAGAQVLLGTFAGAKFSGISISNVRRVLMLSALWAFLLMVIILTSAIAVISLSHWPLVDVLLALSPGGYAEASMIAIAAAAGLTFITAAHFVRMVLVLVAVPVIARLALSSPKDGGGLEK